MISEVFKKQLENKYNVLKTKDKIITIPNIPNVSNFKITNKEDKHFFEAGIIKIAYLGNNQSWQKIPELLNFVQKLDNFIDENITLTIATNEKDWFTSYIANNNFNFKTIITFVEKNNLLKVS